ncbi:MAG: hypothetical protein NC115_12985 [Bacteroidales bacterium]|nr:hypothetical protein [Bacteroides sp.]MCM1422154.1 hypothetical protein [Bacteroides sp.]MCM1503556.1 hypothetical protein [Bacteroidales bacterium]
MPFNLLKSYPEVLEIEHLSDKERTESLKRIYVRDIVDNERFYFREKRIYPIKSNGHIDMERQFTHLTCEEIEEEDKTGRTFRRRVFDKYRSERLHWIKAHTDESTEEDNILVFSIVERDNKRRMDVSRTYIYNQKEKYVIVFEPQQRNGNSYYLLTAYYLNKEYGVKQMKKKYKKKIETIL